MLLNLCSLYPWIRSVSPIIKCCQTFVLNILYLFIHFITQTIVSKFSYSLNRCYTDPDFYCTVNKTYNRRQIISKIKPQLSLLKLFIRYFMFTQTPSQNLNQVPNPLWFFHFFYLGMCLNFFLNVFRNISIFLILNYIQYYLFY